MFGIFITPCGKNKGYWFIDKNGIVFNTTDIDVAKAQLSVVDEIVNDGYRGDMIEVKQFGA